MAERRGLGSFRHHLILTTGLSTLVFVALVAASVFVPLGRALEHAPPGSAFASSIAAHFLDLHRSFWPVVVGALIASVVSGMLLYYRMVGPLIRFRQIYDAVSAGSVPRPITIRRRDYLTAEAEALNGMLAALGDRQAAQQALRAHCEALVDQLAELDSELGEKGGAIVAELRERIGEIR